MRTRIEQERAGKMGIVDFAMQMELDGKAHYEKLETMTPVPGLKKVFSILASDEQDHYEVMKRMNEGVLSAFAGSTVLESAQNVFSSLRFDDELLADLRSRIDVYRYAIRIEVDSITLYEKMLKDETINTGPAATALLMKLIDEEQRHYNVMENIHDLIADHEHFLAWRAFDQVRRAGIV
jgi:hypothetical protein